MEFQAYAWTYCQAETDTDADEIRAWCLDRQSEPVLVRLPGVPLHCYLEFEPGEVQGRDQLMKLVRGLKAGLAPGARGQKDYEASEQILLKATFKPAVTYLYEARQGAALRVEVVNQKALRRIQSLSKMGGLFVRGRTDKVPFKVWEADLPPITKYLAHRGCQFCQWFTGTAEEVPKDDRWTQQREVLMDPASLTPLADDVTARWAPTNPLLFSFDIECYSANARRFPSKENAEDVIMMISCWSMRQNDWESARSTLLVLGQCLPIEGTDVRVFPTEKALLQGFLELIAEVDPEVFIGYNTQGFDVPYLDTRLRKKLMGWGATSRVEGEEPYVRVRHAFSEAYGYQTYYLMEQMSGRIHLDLLNIVKRDHKLRSYKLEAVSQAFLKKGKHDVSARQMFAAYAALKARGGKAELEEYTRVAAYCIQDARLVLELFHKLNVWIAVLEMCNVVHCPPEDLYTRGQQIKSKAQLYEASLREGYVMDYRSDGYPYKGAFVQDPEEGLYDNILVVDFASLYPSIIMAYNICYTTFDSGERYKDEDCTVLDFDETFDLKGDAARTYLNETEGENDCGCREVGVECENPDCMYYESTGKRVRALRATKTVHYHFKFLKKEKREGLLPRLVRALVDKRNQVKEQMKAFPKDSVEYNILDKRQLALKVSANSIYGFLGVQNNALLPLIQGAIAVTYLGRTLIGKVNDHLTATGYRAIYNDTDSAFIDAGLSDPKEVYRIGAQMATEITALFPPPVRIEFEKPIRMLAIKKKKYAYYLVGKDGSLVKGKDGFPELHTKGVVSARRDNCAWQVETFNAVLVAVMDMKPLNVAADIVFSAIERLYYGQIPVEELAVNKSMGSNYKSETAAMKIFGDELKEQGNPVEPGERVDMVVVDTGEADAKLGKKYRLLELYREAQARGEADPLDTDYYVEHMLQNCVDQIVEIGYKHLWKDSDPPCYRYEHRRRLPVPVSTPVAFGLAAVAEGKTWAWARAEYMRLV